MAARLDSQGNKTNKVNTEKFRRLIVRIPEDQFPDRLRILIKGYEITDQQQKDLDKIDPRVQQLVADVANNPQEKLYQLKWIEEKDFTSSSKVNGINYKVYNSKFPLSEITQVHGWADRDDTKNTTQVDVTMYASTESGQPSSTSNTTINMEDVWAYNFTMIRQTMTPTTIINYLLHGTKTGSVISAITDIFTYYFQTVANLPGQIQALPKAIISKFLGPDSAEVQSAIAQVATEAAKYQPVIDQILAVTAIIKEIVDETEGFTKPPTKAIQKYGLLLFSYLLAEVGPDALGSLVYDFFGGFPVTGTPLDAITAAQDALKTIQEIKNA